jgi:hypothetical protein
MSAASPVSSGIVTIAFTGMGLSVEPETVAIPVGGFVEWQMLSAVDQLIVVEIIFHESPFGGVTHHQQVIQPMERADRVSGPARDPGRYKYDVKISTPSGQHLADDDPYIIVTGA